MGAYCIRALIPHHTAQVGELMEVLWSDYYGAAKFGDGREIACIPHTECWFERSCDWLSGSSSVVSRARGPRIGWGSTR